MEFFSLNRQDLAECLINRGYSPVHTKKLFSSVYRGYGPIDLAQPELPQGIEAKLGFRFDLLKVSRMECSQYDQSKKFLLRLADGLEIEAVFMPEKTRNTLCISSQVGCAQACSFCMTGKMGLKRNLTAHEIVSQVMTVRHALQAEVDNVVFMGMGEPLDNHQNVIKALQVLSDPCGLNIAPRKLTVSTVGHKEGLEALANSGVKASIAFSLHAANPMLRSQLIPSNKQNDYREILCKLSDMGMPILIQYTLIANINDGELHADWLYSALSDLNCKVNLIPMNPVKGLRFEAPSNETIKKFQSRLLEKGLRVMVRYSKGQDIEAACGQLVSENSQR